MTIVHTDVITRAIGTRERSARRIERLRPILARRAGHLQVKAARGAVRTSRGAQDSTAFTVMN
jgi:hypothetical protein